MGYDENSYIPCEICRVNKATSIHHIISRNRDRSLFLEICNLMALCLKCHIKYGEINNLLYFLFSRHHEILKQNYAKYDKKTITELLNYSKNLAK